MFGYSARSSTVGLGSPDSEEKVILGELGERGVVYPTCTDEYHPVSGVIRLNVRLEIGSWDRLGVFVGSKDGPAKWLAKQNVVSQDT